ncbi:MULTISPECIES: hypothetical protein [unclassified Streptomyces]|uniref:hypothetical protein n=1 Tax=unclassified Streptomyces TaxID=2593676 RepID=UPI003826C969
MSVSIYYSARRAQPLTGAESAAVERVVAARAESFPYDDEEGLYLYGPGDDDGIIAGSTKLPGGDPGRWLPVTAHVLDSVTELRRAVGGAQWHVHMDDLDVPWDETEGYALPGMRDEVLAAELGGLCDTPGEQDG